MCPVKFGAVTGTGTRDETHPGKRITQASVNYGNFLLERFYNRSGFFEMPVKHPFFKHESYPRTRFYPMSGFTAMMDYITKENEVDAGANNGKSRLLGSFWAVGSLSAVSGRHYFPA